MMYLQDPAGWSIIAPSADSRIVYVNALRGKDTNDGLSRASAKQTLAAGIALLRDGFPDWLALRRGDVWRESLGHWKKSGRSAQEPMVITSYGYNIARPSLLTGNVGGIWTGGGGGSPARIDNLCLLGLKFFAENYAGGGDCTGARLLQPSSNILIEDCEFIGYSQNLVLQGFGGRHTNLTVRRSIADHAWTVRPGEHSQGLYAYGVDGLVLEENLFDHNGWSETVPNAGADIYSHNLYIDNDNTKVKVKGNIIARASSHGLQLRCGGEITDNLFLGNSIAMSFGGGDNPIPGGVSGLVARNVILGGKDIDAQNPRGWGMWYGNVKTCDVDDNLIANNDLGTGPEAFQLDGTNGIGLISIHGNTIYNWDGSISQTGDVSKIITVTEYDNQINWQPDAYLDPSRSVADYNATMGGPRSLEGFLLAAALQSSKRFDARYLARNVNQFIKAGFSPS